MNNDNVEEVAFSDEPAENYQPTLQFSLSLQCLLLCYCFKLLRFKIISSCGATVIRTKHSRELFEKEKKKLYERMKPPQ